MEQDIPSPEVQDNLEAHKIAEEEPKESHENYNDKKISGENHLEKLVEDEDEHGQAGKYFVDKVTGEFYFQSSNGDLEQLLASDTEAGEITDEDLAGESKLPPKEEPVQVAEKLMAAPVDLSTVSLSTQDPAGTCAEDGECHQNLVRATSVISNYTLMYLGPNCINKPINTRLLHCVETVM